MRYESGNAFRRALEDRLKKKSIKSGTPLVRMRKMVAFDRLLARLFSNQPTVWILKGGFALQLRLGDKARTTKDIDMLLLIQHEDAYSILRRAGAIDLGDWFQFEISKSSRRVPEDPGGIRYQIEARLDGRTFERFHIDVGIGDPVLDPVEYVQTPDILEFAGINSVKLFSN